jgi:hypothetical protein
MSVSVQTFFGPLTEAEFSSRDEVDEKLRERFNQLRKDLPPDYRLEDLLSWTREHRMVKRLGSHSYRITLNELGSSAGQVP